MARKSATRRQLAVNVLEGFCGTQLERRRKQPTQRVSQMSFTLKGEFRCCSLHDVLKNSLRSLKISARNLGRELLAETMAPKESVYDSVYVYMFFYILGYSPHVIRISESGKLGIQNTALGIRNPTDE